MSEALLWDPARTGAEHVRTELADGLSGAGRACPGRVGYTLSGWIGRVVRPDTSSNKGQHNTKVYQK